MNVEKIWKDSCKRIKLDRVPHGGGSFFGGKCFACFAVWWRTWFVATRKSAYITYYYWMYNYIYTHTHILSSLQQRVTLQTSLGKKNMFLKKKAKVHEGGSLWDLLNHRHQGFSWRIGFLLMRPWRVRWRGIEIYLHPPNSIWIPSKIAHIWKEMHFPNHHSWYLC